MCTILLQNEQEVLSVLCPGEEGALDMGVKYHRNAHDRQLLDRDSNELIHLLGHVVRWVNLYLE